MHLFFRHSNVSISNCAGFRRASWRIASIFLFLLALCLPLHAEDVAAEEASWIGRFSLIPPTANAKAPFVKSARGLPTFSVLPTALGKQLVRVSLPFPSGSFPVGKKLQVISGKKRLDPDIRILTSHPGTPICVRRAILTFPFIFTDIKKYPFSLTVIPGHAASEAAGQAVSEFKGTVGSTSVEVHPDEVVVTAGREKWQASLIAPSIKCVTAPKVEIVERGKHYLWVRMLVPDSIWPRIIEVRADSLGEVAVRAHLQRLDGQDGSVPPFGWKITVPKALFLTSTGARSAVTSEVITHSFADGTSASIDAGSHRIDFPDARLLRRGQVTVDNSGDSSKLNYLRATADESVPYQDAAWRTATFAISPSICPPLTALLEPPHQVDIPAKYFDSIYGSGIKKDLSANKVLAELDKMHHVWIKKSSLEGDDFGNVTGYPASKFGMNRLNHCSPIFKEYYRTSDMGLRQTALNWCSNFYDLSIWWGTNHEGEFGGTRYNNTQVQAGDHKGDTEFMWRSNTAVSFCTKGYDSFIYAYEETGDPRMAAALHWQVEYARKTLHAGQGTTRNVGDVADFVTLYRFTGDDIYLKEALRLFKELRECLNEDCLFSESGLPIEKDPPFIDDDAFGYKHPFAKSYIMGYALWGLPGLAKLSPKEPKLLDTVRAVARFLASCEDPSGGWRYPGPYSGRILTNQGVEHAAQIARAAAVVESMGEPINELLNAIERTLQARVLVWAKSGQILGGLNGWEEAAGLLKEGKTLQEMYQKPSDRDSNRDYSEGNIGLGYAGGPEGLVYYSEALDFYLAHRPAQSLFTANEQLQKVLDRIKPAK